MAHQISGLRRGQVMELADQAGGRQSRRVRCVLPQLFRRLVGLVDLDEVLCEVLPLLLVASGGLVHDVVGIDAGVCGIVRLLVRHLITPTP